jgi:hypothetical protein
LRQCEELLERPVKQRRFELEAALLLRDLMAISLAVAPPRRTLNARAVGQRQRARRRLGVIHKPGDRRWATMASINCRAPSTFAAEERN